MTKKKRKAALIVGRTVFMKATGLGQKVGFHECLKITIVTQISVDKKMLGVGVTKLKLCPQTFVKNNEDMLYVVLCAEWKGHPP